MTEITFRIPRKNPIPPRHHPLFTPVCFPTTPLSLKTVPAFKSVVTTVAVVLISLFDFFCTRVKAVLIFTIIHLNYLYFSLITCWLVQEPNHQVENQVPSYEQKIYSMNELSKLSTLVTSGLLK
jgi:hypothetical protein